MKENKSYPQIEEEDGSCLTANEPVGAIAYSEAYVEPEICDIPGLPKSWDELMDCIAEGEEEFEVENCVAMLKKFPESGHPSRFP